ncbi:MAG: hypothetical protein ACE5IY_09350 [bacterium]
MKKYILATVLFVLFLCCLEPARNLLSRLLRLEQPIIHEIQEGEWLSKIAIQYYDDASYWKELGLINRAPDGDKIYPGEQIIVPSFDVIQKIRQTRRLSAVNEFVRAQQQIVAGTGTRAVPAQSDFEHQIAEEIKADVVESFGKAEVEEPTFEGTVVEDMVAEKSTNHTLDDLPVSIAVPQQENSRTDAELKTNSSLNITLLASVVALILAFVVGIYLYIKRRTEEEVTTYGSTEDDYEDTEDTTRSTFDFGSLTDDDGADNSIDARNGSGSKIEVA